MEVNNYKGINKGDWYLSNLDNYKNYYEINSIIIDSVIEIVFREHYLNKTYKGVKTIIPYNDFVKYYVHERKVKLDKINEK